MCTKKSAKRLQLASPIPAANRKVRGWQHHYQSHSTLQKALDHPTNPMSASILRIRHKGKRHRIPQVECEIHSGCLFFEENFEGLVRSRAEPLMCAIMPPELVRGEKEKTGKKGVEPSRGFPFASRI